MPAGRSPRPHRRQLEQGERVAGGGPHHVVGHVVGQRRRPSEQVARVVGVQAVELDHVGLGGGQRRGDHSRAMATIGHPLGGQAPDGERQRRDRRRVEPLDVVEGDEHRPVVGEIGEQGAQRHPDDQRVGRLGVEREGAAQGVGLVRRERRRSHPIDRCEQLGEPGECQLRLRLDASGVAARSCRRRRPTTASRRAVLPMPGSPRSEHEPAPPPSGRGQHLLDPSPLGPASHEHASSVPTRAPCRRPSIRRRKPGDPRSSQDSRPSVPSR